MCSASPSHDAVVASADNLKVRLKFERKLKLGDVELVLTWKNPQGSDKDGRAILKSALEDSDLEGFSVLTGPPQRDNRATTKGNHTYAK